MSPTGSTDSVTGAVETRIGLWPLTGYFLRLGTVGFGGPVALVGFMHRDLVEQRRWISEDTYKLSLALAQIMPGPLAAQTAIAIGYFEGGTTPYRSDSHLPGTFRGGMVARLQRLSKQHEDRTFTP